MEADRYHRLADRITATWTSQDVEAVLNCYTDDLVYRDPNTQGPVRGRGAMRAYLTKLFSRWDMTWEAGEVFPLSGSEGVIVKWRATLSPTGSGHTAEIFGIDLVILEGDRIRRNEVYFDRAPLAALLAPSGA
jgi:ketosteroid isomerase-like protein